MNDLSFDKIDDKLRAELCAEIAFSINNVIGNFAFDKRVPNNFVRPDDVCFTVFKNSANVMVRLHEQRAKVDFFDDVFKMRNIKSYSDFAKHAGFILGEYLAYSHYFRYVIIDRDCVDNLYEGLTLFACLNKSQRDKAVAFIGDMIREPHHF